MVKILPWKCGNCGKLNAADRKKCTLCFVDR